MINYKIFYIYYKSKIIFNNPSNRDRYYFFLFSLCLLAFKRPNKCINNTPVCFILSFRTFNLYIRSPNKKRQRWLVEFGTWFIKEGACQVIKRKGSIRHSKYLFVAFFYFLKIPNPSNTEFHFIIIFYDILFIWKKY
jgi:hypothetical protein